MSEALCQCGHSQLTHRWQRWAGWGQCQSDGCPCTAFTPPPTGEPIRLTAEERSQMNCDCAQPYDWDDHVDSCFVPAVESILAARLAGGPTLADARTPESEDTE